MSKTFTREESEPLEQVLSRFCHENNISLTCNTNLTALCNKFNIQTIAMPLDEQKLDGVILIDKNFRVIATNEALEPCDSRFVIAHEFAHFITKSIESPNKPVLFAEKDRVFHGGEKKQEEHNMDYLAAAILVPKEQFIDELFAVGVDIKKLEDRTVKGVRRFIQPNIVTFFANRYNAREEVILRRIAEVACYA